MSVCHIDVETVSEVDLRKTGAFKYAEDPSTKVIICCYAFNDAPVQTWLPETESQPQDLRKHFATSGACLAWNAQFEKVILKECLGIRGNFGCVMAAAAYQSYPLSLDQAATAIGLPMGKDKIGNALMKRMCRPRGFDDQGKPVWWHETDPEKFDRLQSYCRLDVILERSIHKKLASGLPMDEAMIWLIDQQMNELGVRLDKDLVRKLMDIVSIEQARLDAEMQQITGGAVTSCSQVAKLKHWISSVTGAAVPSLDKEGLKLALAQFGATQSMPHAGPNSVLRALKCRQEAAKSSTSKLKAMWNCAGSEDRMRGLIQYYGAMRTGRFAGRMAQPHNYPRPEIDKPENAIAYIKAGMTVEGVQAFWGSPMSVVSACLRGCFIPTENHDYLSVDFSQIEARVLAWLTGQLDILKVFADGEDVYVHAAQKAGSSDRFLGKVLTLACGYGMGGVKFRDTAAKQGLEMSEVLAQEAVDKWRETNSHIVSGWKTLENVCKKAVVERNPQWITPFNNKLQVSFLHDALVIVLPSGRNLFYQKAMMVTGRFGSAQIAYDGLNSYNRKWEQIETYGGKLIENVVQAIARDLLTHAMLQLKTEGFDRIVLTVHDELLLEIDRSTGMGGPEAVKKAVTLITTGPSWSQGIPLAADFWVGDRYRK